MTDENMFINVDPERQWCETHWTEVLESISAGVTPINGLMATIEIFNEWFRAKFTAMGNAFPTVNEPERVMALFEEDSPLCCFLGDETRTLIYSMCIVPPHLRRYTPRVGHVLHVQEARGVIIAEVEPGDGTSYPQIPFGQSPESLN